MARGAAASSSNRDDHEKPQAPDAKSSKRRCVQSACVPCRRRKSKCDGGTPVCATCTAVYKTDCHYDAESESRRVKSGSATTTTAGTKRDASSTTLTNPDTESNADFIIDSLRRLPEDQVYDFIQHIRGDPNLDVASVAETWRKNVPLAPSTPLEDQSLESDLSVLLGKPALTLNGQSRHFGHSANLGLVPEEENFSGGRLRSNSVKPERQGSTWTTVTNDLAFVEELLDLYFIWSHPFYVLFSRECFVKDFRSGREKYCCSLLVNAICAYACHLTDNPAGRTNPSNFRTAGDHFFAEAKRILFEDETPALTTVQALCIMSMREPSTGRDSSGFGYIGRCIRMCVELGLHLNNGADAVLGLTPSEIEVRKITFWGCFTVDTTWSITTGRISQLPRAAITLDKPIIEESVNLPATTSGVPPATVTTHMFLQQFAVLSELVNDNNYMFFAPKDRLTSIKLLDCYSKYRAWYEKLPSTLGIEGKQAPEPHILVLHMLYYAVIVHLFRPMLKVELIHSNVHPRDICIDAANNVSRLVRIYRSLYDFRQSHLLIPYLLLTVCVVHLLYSKDNHVSRENLVEGLQGLEDVHECHYFGARAFRIIYALTKTWDLPWPDELRTSNLMPKSDPDKPHGTSSPPADPFLVAPNTMATSVDRIGSSTPFSPIGQNNRRESLSMFGQNRMQLATHSIGPNSRPSSVLSGHHHQSSVAGPPQMQSTYNPSMPMGQYQYSQAMSNTANLPTTITSPTTATAQAMFWTPMPGIPGPILPRNNYQQMGPMGLESVLRNTDLGDRLGRDGFKLNDDWRSSHVNGFNTSIGGSVYGASNSQADANYVHRNSFSQPSDHVAYAQPNPNARVHDGYNTQWWQDTNNNSGPMS